VKEHEEASYSTQSSNPARQPAAAGPVAVDLRMGDIAEKISTELRNQYLIGYRPWNLARDGKWRKVNVKVNPPAGLPRLTIHARTGYYAPLQ
jgi:hypothetical protein